MKILVVIWFIFCGCAYGLLPNQPKSLGTCPYINNPNDIVWGTLFEETNTYFISCGHGKTGFYPHVGQKLTFVNGDSKLVEKIWIIGTSRSSTTFDLMIGKLDSAVNITPSKAWWHVPVELVKNENCMLNGFAFEGHYSGIGEFFYSVNNVSTDYMAVTATIKKGYSGSPIWYKEKLLGVISAGSNRYTGAMIEEGVYNTGTITPLSLALIKCQENFPELFHSPNTETKLSISMTEDKNMSLVLDLAPGKDYQVMTTSNPNENWFPAQKFFPNVFLQDDSSSTRWQRKHTFKTKGFGSMFFRAESLQ